MAREEQSNRRLESWKEIAGYLDVSVRTAQKLERAASLPVRRLGNSAKPRVLAYESELREWLSHQSSGKGMLGKQWKTVALIVGGLLCLTVIIVVFSQYLTSPAHYQRRLQSAFETEQRLPREEVRKLLEAWADEKRSFLKPYLAHIQQVAARFSPEGLPFYVRPGYPGEFVCLVDSPRLGGVVRYCALFFSFTQDPFWLDAAVTFAGAHKSGVLRVSRMMWQPLVDICHTLTPFSEKMDPTQKRVLETLMEDLEIYRDTILKRSVRLGGLTYFPFDIYFSNNEQGAKTCRLTYHCQVAHLLLETHPLLVQGYYRAILDVWTREDGSLYPFASLLKAFAIILKETGLPAYRDSIEITGRRRVLHVAFERGVRFLLRILDETGNVWPYEVRRFGEGRYEIKGCSVPWIQSSIGTIESDADLLEYLRLKYIRTTD